MILYNENFLRKHIGYKNIKLLQSMYGVIDGSSWGLRSGSTNYDALKKPAFGDVTSQEKQAFIDKVCKDVVSIENFKIPTIFMDTGGNFAYVK